jgi:glycosyltransferase involved in cell wall biosynthesis
MKPLFSVVIPTYNRASKLQRALESVLAQSYDNFEILVMDDGSTDNTAEVVASFADPRITYRWDKNFGGPARPRNRGVALAKGEWICFLDADDWWTVDKLQVCFDFIGDNVDMIYHDLEIVGLPSALFRSKIQKGWHLKKPVLIDLLVKGNAICNSSAVVRKKILDQIGGIDERVEMIASEDYNTWLRIAKISEQFLYIPNTLGFYLAHEQNISHRDMSNNWECSCSDFMSLLSPSQQNKINAGIRYMRGRLAFCNNDYSKAITNLKFSLMHGKIVNIIKSLYMIVIIVVKGRLQK